MNNELNNNEVNNETATPVETPTPVVTPPTEAPVQTESAPVEAQVAPAAPVSPTPTPTPVEETPAQPRLVQIKPSIGGGGLTTDAANANINVVAKKQSIVPVIVLIVGLIGLVISGIWLYNELNHKDNSTTNPNSERLPFSGSFNPIITQPVTSETDTEATTTSTEEAYTNAIINYPDFTGKTIEEATKWAAELGVEIRTEYVSEAGAQSGTIVRQSGVVDTPVNSAEPFIVFVAN